MRKPDPTPDAAAPAPSNQPWLTPGVRGIGLASLLSDLGHEVPTALLPSFLVTVLGAPAAALGLIEGIADTLSGVATKPRGELHSMWNAGAAPARMIEIVSPGGFEGYFIELAEATAAAGRRPDPSVIGAIAGRFGLAFDFADVPDIVARKGLSPFG